MNFRLSAGTPTYLRLKLKKYQKKNQQKVKGETLVSLETLVMMM